VSAEENSKKCNGSLLDNWSMEKQRKGGEAEGSGLNLNTKKREKKKGKGLLRSARAQN